MVCGRPSGSGLEFGAASGATRGGWLEAVFIDFAIQGAAADLEHFRRLELVPLDRLEYSDDVGPFRVAQGWQPVARLFIGPLDVTVEELDIARADESAGCRHGGPGDGALELAYIAGPVVGP